MPIHKLAEGPLTLVVTDVNESEGKFGPQMAIDGSDPDGQEVRVYVSVKSWEQQIKRLKLDSESAIGQCLHIEQVKKDGTTYTNINRASPGSPTVAGVQAAQAVAARSAPAARLTLEEAGELYGKCVDMAIAKFWAPLTAESITVSAEAIQSAAATIFIAVRGKQ